RLPYDIVIVRKRRLLNPHFSQKFWFGAAFEAYKAG
ncbi:unnamed protein product, partial [marine sediment metagenome]